MANAIVPFIDSSENQGSTKFAILYLSFNIPFSYPVPPTYRLSQYCDFTVKHVFFLSGNGRYDRGNASIVLAPVASGNPTLLDDLNLNFMGYGTSGNSDNLNITPVLNESAQTLILNLGYNSTLGNSATFNLVCMLLG